MDNKRPLDWSYCVGNSKACRSSAPGVCQKIKYVFCITSRKITPLIVDGTSPWGTASRVPTWLPLESEGSSRVGPPEASDHTLFWEVGLGSSLCARLLEAQFPASGVLVPTSSAGAGKQGSCWSGLGHGGEHSGRSGERSAAERRRMGAAGGLQLTPPGS